MNVDFVARNFQLDERIKRYTGDRLAKFGRFLDEPIEVTVELVNEKFRTTCELAVSHKHGELRSSEENHDARQAIDLAVEAVIEQAKRGRQKNTDRRRKLARQAQAASDWPLAVVEAASVGGQEGPRVLETSRLPIKPMSLEEAAAQLAHAEQGFVVFRDSATGQVSVLYRRKDQHYGLLSPEP